MLDRIKASILALPPAQQRVAGLLRSTPRSFATLRPGSALLRPMLQEIKKNLRRRRYAVPAGAGAASDSSSSTP